MRKHWFPATVLPALFLTLCSMPLEAQVRQEFIIKKIDSDLVETPQFQAGAYRKQQPGAARSLPWLEIDVNFERNELSKDDPKYTEDLMVSYYILLNNGPLNADKQPTLLTGTTTISDVPHGKGLHTAAFVSPQTLGRFFDGKPPATAQQAVFDVGVTISNSTGVLAIASSKSADVAKQGKGWWESEAGMAKVSGRVLERSQTPFAALAWDYFVPSKPKAAN